MINASLVEGKNKQTCFHSFHLTNISAACISELSLSPVIGGVTSKQGRMGLCLANGNKRSGVKGRECFSWKLPSQCSPIHKYDWEFEEFAKGGNFVLVKLCSSHPGPRICLGVGVQCVTESPGDGRYLNSQ
ncbi:hypothetical protein PFLUV_G00158310 [Perca fluviatilis]|uniref:Uncharacterized protein n=1 Tax=Perca fluviatilis TaxID=8168 RepID=A0A6A5F3H4_PERFL|nr:hypothetical protein PFLUV_G00158310 [Perca fluviatilis]